jgi:hypothetical protein
MFLHVMPVVMCHVAVHCYMLHIIFLVIILPHCQVRAAAASTVEREERALRALERDVSDRENRLASRERMLTEREDKVGFYVSISYRLQHITGHQLVCLFVYV